MAAHPSENFIQMLRKTVFHPQHPAGYPFVATAVVVTLLGFLFVGKTLGFLLLLVTFFVFNFFRDPPRATPQNESFVIAPADGRICEITKNTSLPPEITPDGEGDTPYTKISIFMSAIDVHVNRNPVSGKVLKTAYQPGKYLNAAHELASSENERALALIETRSGEKIGLVQVAGLIARRIVTEHTEGQTVIAGEKFGIIKFGSRADIYVPNGMEPRVWMDQRCISGETVLACLDGEQTAITGFTHP